MAIVIPGRKESTIDKIGKGLGIANSALGIVGSVQGIRKSSAEMDKMEADSGIAAMKRKHDNALSQKQVGDYLADGAKVVPVGTEGARAFSVATPDGGVEQVGLMIPRKKDPALEAAKESARVAREAEKRGLVVPGYDTAAGAKPTAKDAEEVKSLSQARLNMTTTLGKLNALVKKHGSETLPGPIKAEMDRLQGDLKLQVKDIARLGQLTEGDMKLIDEQIPNTTGWGALFTRKSTILDGITKTQELADSKVENAATARGFKAIAAPQTKPPPLDPSKFTVGGKPVKSAEELQLAAQQELARRNPNRAVVKR